MGGNFSKIGVYTSILPRNVLLTHYKSFVRPNIDYCDFIYDQTHNESFSSNLEKFQYNAAVAIKGISKLKTSKKLALESLKFRNWMLRFCVFYKITTLGRSEYLRNFIPLKASSDKTGNSDHTETY